MPPSSIGTATDQALSRPTRHPSRKGVVLVVDDMDDVRRVVGNILIKGGYDVETFSSGEACLSGLARVMPDAILLDIDMPGFGGLETLERIRTKNPYVPVIMLTANDSVETVVTAMRLGAYDYLVKPAGRQKLVTVARNAVERFRMSIQLTSLEREATGNGYPEIAGNSAEIKDVFRQMDRLAPSDVSVLLRGESGTGKELVARAIHAASGRKPGAFVAVNCAAIPESLQESELFGHEKGAFTGATEARMGKFEMANRGTLFLDEVAELTLPLQAKLLRVLQDNTFHRVGGSRELRSDFRVITATHRDLSQEVRAAHFREDLYFRIVVYELELPPLRDRSGDVRVLTDRFLEEQAQKHGGSLSIAPETIELLERYPWPGNVRELQNVLQRAIVFCESGVIHAEHLPARIVNGVDPASKPSLEAEGPAEVSPPSDSYRDDETLNLEVLEKQAIAKAMKRGRGNVTEVGRMLGVSRATLYRKLQKYGLR